VRPDIAAPGLITPACRGRSPRALGSARRRRGRRDRAHRRVTDCGRYRSPAMGAARRRGDHQAQNPGWAGRISRARSRYLRPIHRHLDPRLRRHRGTRGVAPASRAASAERSRLVARVGLRVLRRHRHPRWTHLRRSAAVRLPARGGHLQPPRRKRKPPFRADPPDPGDDNAGARTRRRGGHRTAVSAPSPSGRRGRRDRWPRPSRRSRAGRLLGRHLGPVRHLHMDHRSRAEHPAVDSVLCAGPRPDRAPRRLAARSPAT
jgi:hypothetical protein